MPFAELTDVRCYYELSGRGTPLLMIPGLGGTARNWDGVLELLGEHFSLICPDNRGMGLSIAHRPAKTLADYAVDLVELLDHLQIDQAHVLGISLGGMIAQRLAIDHPSRVNRLVLVSSAHHFGPYLREFSRFLGLAIRKFNYRQFSRLIALLGTSPEVIDKDPYYIEQSISRCGRPGRKALGRQLMCLAASDLPDSDWKITAPTLVMAGGRDAIIPWCYGRQMAQDIPSSQFMLIDKAGHNPLEESADIALPAIVRFLGGMALDEQFFQSQTTRLTEWSL